MGKLVLLLVNISCLIALVRFTSCGLDAATPPLHPEEVKALKTIGKKVGKKEWDFGVDPCTGKGNWVMQEDDDTGLASNVTCDCSSTSCHVVSIYLTATNISATLPPEFSKFRNLKLFDLNRNYFTGSVPQEWATMKLETLSLMGNRLSGPFPKVLTSITTLTNLSIEGNNFSGSIPPEIGKLINLQSLHLSSNAFTGELPVELAKLVNLTDMRISDNNFSGRIPGFIGKWKRINKLQIQGSSLEGPIPSSILALTSLSDLRISDLKGRDSHFPPLHNLHSLKTLILRNCLLNGEIPEYIGDMKKLKTLDLSYNNLSGAIPESFHKLTKADFMYLTGNHLTGSVPGWILERNKNADVSYNTFTWEASSPIECPRGSVNLVESYSKAANEFRVPSCLRQTFPCSASSSQYKYSLHINCGGKELNISGGDKYEADREPRGASMFYLGQNWALSSTGNFMDNDIDADNYLVTNTSALSNVSAVRAELYTTARISPLSLTYYGLCLMKGNYTVSLHFAEIIFKNDRSYYNLGKRIFDVYIQGVLVLKDFNIQEETGGASKPIVKNFTAVVTSNTLKIHLYWGGKGTTGIPSRGMYGPLISAISVVPNFQPPSVVGKKNHLLEIVVSGTAIAAIVFSLILIGIFWRRGWLGGQNSSEKELRGLDLQTGIFSLRQIKAATKNFDAGNKIGEGGFGSVYRGLLSDGTIIAVKQLSSKSKQGNREFVTEIGMISALQHPNLVKLYGCCVEGNQLLLVYEYMENNCLSRALFGKDATLKLKLDWPARQKICLDIARGLAYLHEESRIKIVHRDIKTSNVLLDKNLNAKISDFGLAKLNEDDVTHISTRIAGTIGYMAPEYAMRGYLTNKADVYSFGVVTLEIVSGKSNTNYRPNEDFVYLLDWAYVLRERGSLLDLVDPDLGSEYSSEEAMVMLNVALLCTNASPTLRPTMSQVVSLLEGRTSVQDLLSDLGFSSINSKFKALVNHFWQNPSQTMSLSSNGPETDSISSNIETEERSRLLSLRVNGVQSQI
ncbi:probable LRR receptor-like serine/threonine-protein kinase At1g07650 isoform X2 [Hibiscus syriacus]|uniref:probable LRR receptor-like serine/threonine-protein kinase At1g07650 isoform X2 n=1 Tax=Hibiscus syriacus TaxID=106335 RepID=UPI001924E090|nr:probable LRR receptor-like serine/threonine-protein kinase At1g07650 isoform X2 [Hibiscus syriacus]